MWKSLFLPNGTLMRMRYKGEFLYARIAGDHLVYKGERLSPSELAARITGTARNAGRDQPIWCTSRQALPPGTPATAWKCDFR
jgi:hypothetical protein